MGGGGGTGLLVTRNHLSSARGATRRGRFYRTGVANIAAQRCSSLYAALRSPRERRAALTALRSPRCYHCAAFRAPRPPRCAPGVRAGDGLLLLMCRGSHVHQVVFLVLAQLASLCAQRCPGGGARGVAAQLRRHHGAHGFCAYRSAPTACAHSAFTALRTCGCATYPPPPPRPATRVWSPGSHPALYERVCHYSTHAAAQHIYMCIHMYMRCSTPCGWIYTACKFLH